MQPTFQAEAYADVRAEVEPLLLRHWREVAFYPDIELSPDWKAYDALAAAGMLRIFTVRDESRVLIGYTVIVVRQGLHYSKCIEASEDLLFVVPEHRKGRIGLHLITFSDEELSGEGVEVIRRHVKLAPELDYGALLERLRYEPVDRIFSKRLRDPGYGR